MSERVVEAVNGNGSNQIAEGQVAIEGSDDHANFAKIMSCLSRQCERRFFW